ncbi:HIRAN domain-containing protein [Companilactobacillus sp. DQM5]|uniref:HIRAN domain-containing protein n=1 Tax=Companilactobacillus sp. DQM5 TaxID=3463359 RepID=UPI00405845D0
MKNSENIDIPYIKSSYIDDFTIAGFKYYDGLNIINKLKLNDNLTLVTEEDNPYDPNAIAIYYNKYKLGYVPSDKNSFLNTILYFGHENIFEAKILSIDTSEYPDRQVRVVLNITDNRKK